MDDLLIEQEFAQSVNQWIIQATQQGITEFNNLLIALPGVYPTIALKALKNLSKQGHISEKISSSAEEFVNFISLIEKQNYEKTEFIRLPIPHPLDYEWRFAEEAISFLIQRANQTDKTDSLLLLGTPSILRYTLKKNLPINAQLLDKNESSLNAFKDSGFGKYVKYCDLTKNELPDFQAKTIILDPPWYEEYLKIFTWAAQQLCELNGYIFISLPADGTRPGIISEIANYLSWAKSNLFLDVVEYKRGVLPYESPLFERNALKADGIFNFPNTWRRGDLIIFQVKKKNLIERPKMSNIQLEECWREIKWNATRIRIRESKSDNGFSDPSLISLIKGDILPSVSRRDIRRKSVDVWTTGNRVFSCHGENTLFLILEALSREESEQNIVKKMKVSGLEKETNMVSNTIQQLTNIFQQEQKEYQNY